MYTVHFDLNETPFSIAPDPLYLYMSERHREALAHLQYGIRSNGGFVLLTGEVGTGKTTLCRSLIEQLPPDVVVAYVLNPKVSVVELLETICDELRIARPEQGSIKQLVDRLNRYLLEANAAGRKTVLIIDEAQNLSVEVLEQLRLLTNLETNRYKLLQIVLLGQPELLQLLNRPEMRQLAQRVTARFHLGPLAVDEIDLYVRHRLKIAGCERALFPVNLAALLWKSSGGVPRLINLVCDRALLGAYACSQRTVDERILRQAAREVFGGGDPEKPAFSPRTGLLAALLVAVLVVSLSWLWRQPSLVSSWLQRGSAPSVAAPLASSNHAAASFALGRAADVVVEEAAAEPLPTSWPHGFAAGRSRQAAFADLAVMWGMSAPADRSDPCRVARDQGLECLARQDSLETLRQFDRPAVLTLYDDDGSPFHVVMSQLDQAGALFVAGAERRRLSIEALTSRWFGDYLILWQRPPLESYLLKPGDDGEAVSWLAETLQELGVYRATGTQSVLDGRLLGAFKRFQFSRGLTPDGVLGPISLIHLNRARQAPGPRLDAEAESQGAG
jgi:general secretion pathway protein A